tara:strand:+ start:686 stop:1513 length:828 start_codon:yes stop_codon:yes gene_type:complete
MIIKKLPSFKRSLTLLNKRQTIKSITNPLPGLDIGIPLTIFQNSFTSLHYGESIVTTRDVLLQFLIGYYVYGTDRYNDALEYCENPYSTPKKDLYEYIFMNQDMMKNTLGLSYVLTLFLLCNDQHFWVNLPFIGLLELTNKYKDLKPKLGIYKPAFIAILWTASAIWMPSVLHDHNYNILLYPQDYLPCTLTIFSASNIIDNKDIVEDRQNNITTIPVVYGETNSIRISLVGLILSSLILGFNPHYLDFPVVNSLLEIQNGAISFLPFVLNATLA